jgi:uncharacterized protein YlxW (UPF0749 family)
MELEEKVKSLKERVALLNAKVRPSNATSSNKAQTEVSRQEDRGDSRSAWLRKGLAEAKEEN